MERYKWMIKEGDIYYSEKENKYFLVIGAEGVKTPELDFYDAWELLTLHEIYDGIGIVFVELLNNRNYKKSIQTQPLRDLNVFYMKYCDTAVMRYDRHISMSKYKVDILKRRLIDNSFSDIKEVYFKRFSDVINYIKPCIEFLDQFQMYQNIIINENNRKDSAVYLGISKGTIMYYSRTDNYLKTIEFEDFKVAVKLDKGVCNNKIKYLKHGTDIKELKKEIQRQKSILRV